jgi:peptidoglycan/LPS O-acetylase OafA/YrhL
MVETNKKYIYPFVDLIRFISMLGIVWAHTDAFPLQVNSFEFLKNIGDVEYFIVFKQIFKFSVVCFFMISGFLLGDNILLF